MPTRKDHVFARCEDSGVGCSLLSRPASCFITCELILILTSLCVQCKQHYGQPTTLCASSSPSTMDSPLVQLDRSINDYCVVQGENSCRSLALFFASIKELNIPTIFAIYPQDHQDGPLADQFSQKCASTRPFCDKLNGLLILGDSFFR